ncbi:DNA alkylation repair protein [Mucilaginibacter antarcticus]|uniref:DNA alkylation repair protein n=1 Tax=Mucilaginibacter antarcticus TaxID=1855725 RepID=UPI00362F9063
MRLHNKKYGAGDNQFGVKMGDIRNIANKIKTDHELGLALWETGNIDARFLAALIINPKQLSIGEVDSIVCTNRFAHVADWLSSYVIKEHPDKEELRERWMKSEDAMAARAGWSLTAGRVTRNHEGIDITALLDRIEKEMPIAPTETQWTMNTTLAQIGINHPQFRERALAIGERLESFVTILHLRAAHRPLPRFGSMRW